MYQTEEFGLFIGLTTANYENIELFTDKEIKQPFERYRNKIMHYCKELSEKEQDLDAYFKYLYTPKVYGVFGSFDLMTLAIVDDFAFATRYFHPFNAHIENDINYAGKNYTFHVITGLCPRIETLNSTSESLIEKSRSLFSPTSAKKFPFVGNLSLKLNNALLIGSAGSLIDLVLAKIHSTLNIDNENIISIIYHSLSWNEISILIFCDNIESISNKMLQVRELNFGSLKENAENKTLYENVIKKSLMHKELINNENIEDIDHFENSHLFVHTHSIFGYDSDLLFSKNISIDLEQRINFIIRCDIKPGHLQAFQRDLAAYNATVPLGKITSGRADYTISIQDKNAFQKYWDIIQSALKEGTLKHIRKISTIPGFPDIDPHTVGKYFPIQGQFLLHTYLNKYSFSLDYINQVRDTLKELRFPVTLQDKISRMFVIYNDGIHDPILYGYFIELKQYLITIYEILHSYLTKNKNNSEYVIYYNIEYLVDEIKPWVKIFEEAYKNRFGQSYIMNEITDFNLEFTGGIQQLISAYDGAYKSFTALLGKDTNRSIVYISGEPNIESDKYSVRLNYFHLFQPEFFATAATHEAANYFLERISTSDSHLAKKLDIENIVIKYKALMQPLKTNTASALDAASVYFIRDIITLYLTYNRDFELFFYWHWASFLQTGTVYNTLGVINQQPFNDFMARMFLIDKYINEDNSFFKGHLFPPFCAHSMVIQKAWEHAVATVKPGIDNELAKNKAYFDKIQELFSFILLEEIGVEDEIDTLPDLQSFIAKLTAHEKIPAGYFTNQYPEFSRISKDNRYYEYLIYTRFEEVENLSSLMAEAFDNANIYNIDSFQKLGFFPKEVKSSFCYHVLFYTYLKYIKEKIARNSWSLLFRNIPQGQRTKSAHTTPLRIDPFGGIFSDDVEIRKALLKVRAVFLKTMWDFSIQNKLEQFED